MNPWQGVTYWIIIQSVLYRFWYIEAAKLNLHCWLVCSKYVKSSSCTCQIIKEAWKYNESSNKPNGLHTQYLRKCSRLLSTTAGDKKSHSCVCRSWSLSACDFQYVLMRTGSVTYGDASSHGPTWLILSSLPSPHRWYHTANCNKIPKRLFFTVKYFFWLCHAVKAKYCVLSLKRGQETGWSSIFGLCSLIKYSWGKVAYRFIQCR